ncbi:gamma-glutamyltransferase family protein [Rivibacter subsaxonicus]|uniref:Gamma-glutamyltransferase 1 n=1 Tax=Rivibacter subsaxonicus TaxID=457575 RepID=A0A4Q7VNK3_9BURK|nr:gamma-glutamyltransferase [Rivibacter subsaxonicus]RZT97960.1 gamma-glutamyltransferase 1 [Rivibacter subsaxonicus]
MSRRTATCWAAAALTALTGCQAPPPLADPALQPEAASDYRGRAPQRFQREAVVAAHPLAAEAGAAMLAAGGSAADAAIAAQLVLAVVEPQSSGLGGGGFALVWDGQRVSSWDGRESAPAAIDERLFLDADGRPLAFEAAALGGRAVGAPGLPRLLESLHRQHGRLPWAALFEPAIRAADAGFALGPRLHRLLTDDAARLTTDARARALFFDADGRPWPIGHQLRNPALAQTLRLLAARGAEAFYAPGQPIAPAVIAAVRGDAGNPGRLALADLATYRSIEREPLCRLWQAYRICGMASPSSGGFTLLQILLLLDRVPATSAPLLDGLPAPELLHRYSEVSRLAFADREILVADPAFEPAATAAIARALAPTYLDARAARVGTRSMGRAEPGLELGLGRDAGLPPPSTTHLSVVDAQGRAVALTSSIESQFGARRMVSPWPGLAGGFLLNNQLTDFSFLPRDAQGRPVANRPAPSKRPRSSMAPTLVFACPPAGCAETADDQPGPGERLQLVTGSPGGVPIIHFTAKTILGTLAWNLDAQAVADLPNFGSLNGPTLLESGRFAAATLRPLEARGHRIVETALPSGAHLLLRAGPGWDAGIDPRREGAASGR